MRPLRVLIAGHNLVNPLNRARVEALARQPGLELTVLVPHRWTGSFGEEYAPAPAARPYGLHPRRVYFRGRNQQHLYLYGPGLLGFARAQAPDLVHVEEEPYSLVAFQLARVARALDRPLVLTAFQNVDKRRPVPFCWTRDWVLSRVRAAFVASPDAGQVLRACGFAGPTAPFALGVDPGRYRPEPACPREAGFTVGFLGRLEPVKAVDLLLRALVLRPAVRLVVVGTGTEEARLRALASALGVAARVRWEGPVAHEEVPARLAALDALALPSVTLPGIREQFGRVLVEAMACGVPVVGSSSGEIPRVIGDAGLVFPEGDAAALAACLAELEGSPARRRALAQAGRARVLRAYTWDAIAAGMARFYREAAG